MSQAPMIVDQATMTTARAMVDDLLKRGCVQSAEVTTDADGVVVVVVPHAPVRQITFTTTVSRD